jgi:hypothetical protein
VRLQARFDSRLSYAAKREPSQHVARVGLSPLAPTGKTNSATSPWTLMLATESALPGPVAALIGTARAVVRGSLEGGDQGDLRRRRAGRQRRRKPDA